MGSLHHRLRDSGGATLEVSHLSISPRQCGPPPVQFHGALFFWPLGRTLVGGAQIPALLSPLRERWRLAVHDSDVARLGAGHCGHRPHRRLGRYLWHSRRCGRDRARPARHAAIPADRAIDAPARARLDGAVDWIHRHGLDRQRGRRGWPSRRFSHGLRAHDVSQAHRRPPRLDEAQPPPSSQAPPKLRPRTISSRFSMDPEIDRILDKISREGFASVTPEERETLDRAARTPPDEP